ncbi:hypothetical protein FOL88_03365 [Lactobacillus reuteri]|uniref:hypothetical protein n=1 Tax=Limosilactobacillus reuteri TaxID=1598 RepID=UPI00146F4D41|nr:hypothetical protein [Limosilactobacillus reuteri]NMV54016.1 hypothetical protein [Limosilactobacillus reuteri]NMV57460.1 hypothetical protein [Limosilactobacillus reuteri]
MLVRGRVEKQGKKFIIHNPSAPTFDDYISDLAVMFEMYPAKGKQQLRDVRVALGLIEDLEKAADRLSKMPRDKEFKSDEI